MRTTKQDKLRMLGRLAVSLAHARTISMEHQAECLLKLRRFVERNVDVTGDTESLSFNDLGDFDVTYFEANYEVFSVEINGIDYGGDFVIDSRSESEAVAKDVRIWLNDILIKDPLLLEVIEKKLNDYLSDHTYELYQEHLESLAEQQRESQEER